MDLSRALPVPRFRRLKTLNRLFTERPKITGISLPGMPQGSPGMIGLYNRVAVGKAWHDSFGLVARSDLGKGIHSLMLL